MDPHTPKITDPNGDRPTIRKAGTGSKFKPGAKVYFQSSSSRSLSGPYYVASVTSQGKYTLEDEHGNKANGGNVVEDNDLQKV